jgi:hypothetical protein
MKQIEGGKRLILGRRGADGMPAEPSHCPPPCPGKDRMPLESLWNPYGIRMEALWTNTQSPSWQLACIWLVPGLHVAYPMLTPLGIPGVPGVSCQPHHPRRSPDGIGAQPLGCRSDMARAFHEFLDKAQRGETVLIREHGKAVARLVLQGDQRSLREPLRTLPPLQPAP